MLLQFFISIFIIVIFLLVLFHQLYYALIFWPIVDHYPNSHIPHEDIYIDHIHAWYFNNFKNRPIILFCHGNTGNISHRDYIINLAHINELNLLLFDYSGYGKSAGWPSTQKIKDDGLMVYDWLVNSHQPSDIIIWGESLGGAVAAYVAYKRECRCLLLMATFSSINDIAKIKDGIYNRMVSKFLSSMTDTLPTKKIIKEIKCPILIVHSINDTFIPYACAVKNFERITSENKKFITIDGDHSSPMITLKDFSEILEFCNLKIKDYKQCKRRLRELARGKPELTETNFKQYAP